MEGVAASYSAALTLWVVGGLRAIIRNEAKEMNRGRSWNAFCATLTSLDIIPGTLGDKRGS